MTDAELYAEIYNERAGICQFDGGLPASQAEAIAAREALAQVAKHRGQPAADRLRADALVKLKGGK